MAKRFTDTNKYKKPFIRSLEAPYKLLWDYLYHDCDHAGIWIVDFDIAQIYIGKDAPVNETDALECFNSVEVKIIEFDNGNKWFIPSFIEFQYGELNELNRAHKSVLSLLKKYGLLEKENKALISPFQGAKDKAKDKDKDKDKEKEKDMQKEKGKDKDEAFLGKKTKFRKEVYSYIKEYPSQMIKEFFEYWSETKPKGYTMRWEMQPTYDLNRRLKNWKKNQRDVIPTNNKIQNITGSRHLGDTPESNYYGDPDITH